MRSSDDGPRGGNRSPRLHPEGSEQPGGHALVVPRRPQRARGVLPVRVLRDLHERAVRDDLAAFQNPEVQILAVSVDHPYALKAWADAEGYAFPLLADFWPHGGVAQEYGVFNAKAGFALRGTFLVDKTGTVRFAEVNGPGEPRNQDAWRKALAEV